MLAFQTMSQITLNGSRAMFHVSDLSCLFREVAAACILSFLLFLICVLLCGYRNSTENQSATLKPIIQIFTYFFLFSPVLSLCLFFQSETLNVGSRGFFLLSLFQSNIILMKTKKSKQNKQTEKNLLPHLSPQASTVHCSQLMEGEGGETDGVQEIGGAKAVPQCSMPSSNLVCSMNC